MTNSKDSQPCGVCKFHWNMIVLPGDTHNRNCPHFDDEEKGCACHGCGGRYKVDVEVPDDLWNRIRPEGKPEGAGLLCGRCIFSRIEALGKYDDLILTRVRADGAAPVVDQGDLHQSVLDDLDNLSNASYTELRSVVETNKEYTPDVHEPRFHNETPDTKHFKFYATDEEWAVAERVSGWFQQHTRAIADRLRAAAPLAATRKNSLLREPVNVVAELTRACEVCRGPCGACDCLPPLVITRNGVPYPDQKVALQEFKQACTAPEGKCEHGVPWNIECLSCGHSDYVEAGLHAPLAATQEEAEPEEAYCANCRSHHLLPLCDKPEHRSAVKSSGEGAQNAAREIHDLCDRLAPEIPNDSTSYAPTVEQIAAIISRHLAAAPVAESLSLPVLVDREEAATRAESAWVEMTHLGRKGERDMYEYACHVAARLIRGLPPYQSLPTEPSQSKEEGE